MPLPKKTKIILAIAAFMVLAALVGGSIYFKNKKAAATQKIGAEETETPSTELDKAVCVDCQEEGEEPSSEEHPIEPLDITPSKENPETV